MTADGGWPTREGEEAEQVCSIERARLRALVAADMAVARLLHADDFQLITPTGRTFSKEQYLGAITGGEIHYLKWEPEEEITVRLYGPVALIRYQAHLEMGDPEQPLVLHCWHTDAYEKRDGHWQVVWSQATAIR
jgi:hypothetical protein